MPFGNLWGKSYTKFVILDIKVHFICSESNLQWNMMFENIRTKIVGYYHQKLDIGVVSRAVERFSLRILENVGIFWKSEYWVQA